MNMLEIVPSDVFDALLREKPLLLNPVFGDSSHLVGGADADLIAGNLLMDFKTSKQAKILGRELDQLLGYFLLARRQRQFDPTFPAIERVALYFCRHGYLWIVEASVWTEHSEFSEIERWFFQRAAEVFGK